MYTGEVDTLEKDNFEDVNKMAHVFDVSWLTKRCLKFYKTDVLNFENNSYDEILFACEIASRAHYNLKQSKYVSCFVKNVTFDGIGKVAFLNRYMAGFVTLSQRRIDMSLAIAANDLYIIGNCIMSYLSLALECKKFDDNSLYILRKLDVKRFIRTFPSQFNELVNFLVDISKESDLMLLLRKIKKKWATTFHLNKQSNSRFMTIQIVWQFQGNFLIISSHCCLLSLGVIRLSCK